MRVGEVVAHCRASSVFLLLSRAGREVSALFVAIMPSHGEHVDTNGLFVDGIDESGSFVNASAPQTGEVAFEGFGFAGAGGCTL